jgi:hypothetical protein
MKADAIAVKKYSGWDNVAELDAESYEVRFSEFTDGKEVQNSIGNIRAIFTHESMTDYAVVAAGKEYFIGTVYPDNNTIIFF